MTNGTGIVRTKKVSQQRPIGSPYRRLARFWKDQLENGLGNRLARENKGKSTEKQQILMELITKQILTERRSGEIIPLVPSEFCAPLLPFPSLRVHSSGALREPFLLPPVQALLEYSFL
jgi:hypothetical protein